MGTHLQLDAPEDFFITAPSDSDLCIKTQICENHRNQICVFKTQICVPKSYESSDSDLCFKTQICGKKMTTPNLRLKS